MVLDIMNEGDSTFVFKGRQLIPLVNMLKNINVKGLMELVLYEKRIVVTTTSKSCFCMFEVVADDTPFEMNHLKSKAEKLEEKNKELEADNVMYKSFYDHCQAFEEIKK